MERTIVTPLVKLERTCPRTSGVETAVRSIAESYDLTRRETEILELLAEHGLTNREIAERCIISEKTVKIHISNIMKKTGIGSIRKLFSMIFISMNDGLSQIEELERPTKRPTCGWIDSPMAASP